MHVKVLVSRVRLFAAPWAVAHQAPLSIEFSRQEYWSGLPLPSPGYLPDPEIEPRSPALQANSLPSVPLVICHLISEILQFPAHLKGKSKISKWPRASHCSLLPCSLHAHSASATRASCLLLELSLCTCYSLSRMLFLYIRKVHFLKPLLISSFQTTLI